MSRDDGTGSAEFRWRDGRLDPAALATSPTLLAADSWLIEDGRVLALELHRERFGHAVERQAAVEGQAGVERPAVGRPAIDAEELAAFWRASIARLPRDGAWFPRVEVRGGGSPEFALRVRSAPARARTVVLATAQGPDRRTVPTVKGPDLAAMSALRDEVARDGADEAVICSPEGYVIEGAYSALLWWRGKTLCAPSDALGRVHSVTARSVLTLAAALGIETIAESVTPAELTGLEIWVLNSLHGIRIATDWIDGPAPAEEPGRLALWRDRLGKLSRPIGSVA